MPPIEEVGSPLVYERLPGTHFIHRADMRLLAVPDGSGIDAIVEVAVDEDNSNGAGGLQGGMVATLIDCSAGCAVRGRVREGDRFSTQDLSVHYLAVVRQGPARASAVVRRAGRRSIVVQVDVIDVGDEGRLCAIATVTFAVDPVPAASN
jgi:uncharacterized protein (TIGR00369 family)